jgi:hypothetical protein
MEWNRDEWQGRTKEQVERNYNILSLSFKFFLLTIIIMVLLGLFGFIVK